mmetsp:Transcript_13370/g.37909  ORF Transcript_13370/g.37909 Transcript_13370/m.37909 type:complete len:237 (-) Transcript_13370:851-1561(-)
MADERLDGGLRDTQREGPRPELEGLHEGVEHILAGAAAGRRAAALQQGGGLIKDGLHLGGQGAHEMVRRVSKGIDDFGRGCVCSLHELVAQQLHALDGLGYVVHSHLLEAGVPRFEHIAQVAQRPPATRGGLVHGGRGQQRSHGLLAGRQRWRDLGPPRHRLWIDCGRRGSRCGVRGCRQRHAVPHDGVRPRVVHAGGEVNGLHDRSGGGRPGGLPGRGGMRGRGGAGRSQRGRRC